MKHLMLVFVLLTFSVIYSQSAGDIVITEIMQNPSAVSDSSGEYFEIFNTTSSDIDINGWIISDNDNDSHTIDNGGPLLVLANNYFVFGRNGDTTSNGGYTANYVYSSFLLTNDSDEVIITTPNGLIVDSVEYDGGTTFPDPTGASMEFTGSTSLENDSGENWQLSTETFGDGDNGTPGSENSEDPVLSIAEFNENNDSNYFLYPNPTNTGQVKLSIDSTENTDVKIFNLLGQKVLTSVFDDGILDTSSLSKGTYFLLMNGLPRFKTTKLVVE